MKKPPEKLSKKARSIWVDIENNRTRKLNEADYALIEHFCHEIDLYDLAVSEIMEGDFTNEHNQVSPAVTVANKSANNIRQLYKAITQFMRVEELESKHKLRPVKNY